MYLYKYAEYRVYSVHTLYTRIQVQTQVQLYKLMVIQSGHCWIQAYTQYRINSLHTTCTCTRYTLYRSARTRIQVRVHVPF